MLNNLEVLSANGRASHTITLPVSVTIPLHYYIARLSNNPITPLHCPSQ